VVHHSKLLVTLHQNFGANVLGFLGHFRFYLTQMVFDLAKALTIDKMHRSNQIVKICTSFAHPSFGRIQFQKATHTDYGKLKPHPN
jgi:hypothetical protein